MRDHAEDLALAVSQFGKEMRGWHRTHASEELDKARCDGWTEDGFSMCDSVNCAQDLRFVCALQEVAACPGAHCRKDRVVVFQHGQRDDADPWLCPQNLACGLNAVHFRHVQVHKDDIRIKLKRPADGLCPISGLADNTDCWLGGKQCAQTATHQWVIVHEQYANDL